MEASSAQADFARVSSTMLRSGLKESALRTAADGVRTFPTYLGGYILLAECYAALGFVDDARVILSEAERRFPCRHIVKLTANRLDSLSVQSDAAVTSDEEVPVQPLVHRRRQTRERSEQPSERKESPLRIIELGHSANDNRIIRSSSVRLIPGLEYTSLRFEGSTVRGDRAISVLPDAPSFRSFHAAYRREASQKVAASASSAGGTGTADHKTTLTLEQLADRIGRVRMTSDVLEAKPPAPDPLSDRPRQNIVTETLARIYMQQKSFDRAIESFTVLKERHPDRAVEFQKLIDECISERDRS